MTHHGARRIEWMLRLTQWGFVAGSAWVALNAAWFRDPPPQPRRTVRADSDHGNSAVAARRLEDWRSIWERNLRDQLIKPEPVEAPKPAPPPPAAPVKLPRLVATFVENGTAWGLFVESSGAQRVRTAGEKIEQFEITDIQPGSCTIRKGQKNYEVRVVGPSLPSGSGSRGRN